jgi:hypothetical protein
MSLRQRPQGKALLLVQATVGDLLPIAWFRIWKKGRAYPFLFLSRF